MRFSGILARALLVLQQYFPISLRAGPVPLFPYSGFSEKVVQNPAIFNDGRSTSPN